jgi:hypothetical protein
MAEESVRQDALDWLNSVIASDEAEEWEDAEEFVALTTNAETEKVHINGTFPDALTALSWAEQHQKDLNQGAPPDEEPFVVTVFPVVPVT